MEVNRGKNGESFHIGAACCHIDQQHSSKKRNRFAMAMPVIHAWKKAPLVRILIPVIAGIILHWYTAIEFKHWLFILTGSLVLAAISFYLPLVKRFSFSWISGVAFSLSFVAAGGLLAWLKDIRNSGDWAGHHLTPNVSFIVSIDEAPLEKNKTFKANASINFLAINGKQQPVKGKIIVYFKKDSLSLPPVFGTQIVFRKKLQPIQNSGNPGGFDYKRYCLFQQITHQVYLESKDFSILPHSSKKWLPQFLEDIRQTVLKILRANISGPKEAGLAEALLIGYKQDLDKTLVQSYTNTGVVHIIAISGLHLGLIYGLLVMLLKPLQRKKRFAWLRPVLIVAGLWLFSLLAGAQPSILRSAVMFTCIVLGETLSRKTSIYNTLALSALLLLCYNPYWLWDVGFQLSYSAVLSIILFMQPIYNLFYIKNKLLDLFWKINAVTIAAQILTLPVSVYHFHQFPLFFLLTNVLAVPLSSAILVGEIIICVLAPIPALASLAGKLVSAMIRLMNAYVERIEALPNAVWQGLQIDIVQTVLLFVLIAGVSHWLFVKRKMGLYTALLALLSSMIIRAASFREAGSQLKMIVYNVPKRSAIDFVIGRNCFFNGDSSLIHDVFAYSFHLKPARVLNRTQLDSDACLVKPNAIVKAGKTNLLIIDGNTLLPDSSSRQELDVVIISGNPRISPQRLTSLIPVRQIVLDGSVSPYKARVWKKACDSLRIPHHDVTEKGAFAMTLN